jgi:predicted signal transduction protein with EAL and GGDEF domain
MEQSFLSITRRPPPPAPAARRAPVERCRRRSTGWRRRCAAARRAIPRVRYVDLDGLKPLDDGYREGDLVARLGGDQFVVTSIVDAGDDASVDALSDRPIEAVRRCEVPTPDVPHRLGCSIGIVVADTTQPAEQPPRRADAALHAAKAAGRGRSAWATADRSPA